MFVTFIESYFKFGSNLCLLTPTRLPNIHWILLQIWFVFRVMLHAYRSAGAGRVGFGSCSDEILIVAFAACWRGDADLSPVCVCVSVWGKMRLQAYLAMLACDVRMFIKSIQSVPISLFPLAAAPIDSWASHKYKWFTDKNIHKTYGDGVRER
jgi:hypothetical protein